MTDEQKSLEQTRWDGVATRDVYKEHVMAARDALADAARDGDWPTVLERLADQPEWVNAVRIGGTSHYAPLHQAAWYGAPPDVVRELIRLGAWRTLRTADGRRAVDIAASRGHTHLDGLLRPVVHHAVPADTLAAVERRLHALIEEVAGGLTAARDLRLRLCLPQLEPLTELGRGEMHFPVPGMYGGFSLRLADQALIVESWSRVVGGSGQRHRITADGTILLESGFG